MIASFFEKKNCTQKSSYLSLKFDLAF